MKGKPKKVTVGSVWDSRSFGKFQVVEYKTSKSIVIEFIDTKFRAEVQSINVTRGSVKDKLYPSICGVGFIGDGPFKSTAKGVATKEYKKWQAMIARCYDPYTINKKPSYKDCFVCEEWHNFQNFAEWYAKQDGKHEGCLDKDIKSPGNKLYCPDNCILVQADVNNFITGCEATRGENMIGSHWCKRARFYHSSCRNPKTGKQDFIGYYDSDIKAHLAWRKRKSELAYELAMIQDREEVKQALLNWKEALDNKLIHPY